MIVIYIVPLRIITTPFCRVILSQQHDCSSKWSCPKTFQVCLTWLEWLTFNPSGWNTDLHLVNTFNSKQWYLIKRQIKGWIRERLDRMSQRQEISRGQTGKRAYLTSAQGEPGSSLQWSWVRCSWIKRVQCSGVEIVHDCIQFSAG